MPRNLVKDGRHVTFVLEMPDFRTLERMAIARNRKRSELLREIVAEAVARWTQERAA